MESSFDSLIKVVAPRN